MPESLFSKGFFEPHQEEVKEEPFAYDKVDVEKHLVSLAHEIFIPEKRVGYGNFGEVFRDTENGICYKRIKPGAEQLNNVKREGEFLDDLCDLDESVIVPRPVAWSRMYWKDEKNMPHKTEVLAMKLIDGVRLKDVLDPFEEDERKVFPESFNPTTFFESLRKFVQKMHTEKSTYHRDIWDRNIMIERKTGKPVLYDFGDAVFYSENDSEETGINPYGGHYYPDVEQIDYDLDQVNKLEAQVIQYLTKNKNNI